VVSRFRDTVLPDLKVLPPMTAAGHAYLPGLIELCGEYALPHIWLGLGTCYARDEEDHAMSGTSLGCTHELTSDHADLSISLGDTG
jgi:hypothetical protein